MDLRFFAGHILAKTEIGKNFTLLPAKLNKFQMINESFTIEHLLSFKENSIKNLYTFDLTTNVFRLEHQDGEYLARASAVLNPLGVRFTAEFVEDHIAEFGISYVGCIRIHQLTENFDIKVPGELSYDPACIPGDKMWVNNYQITKIVVFVVILVKAALLGATKKFLKRLYTVIKPIISLYYHKEELFRWMYKQVKHACIYKRQPPSYATFLQKNEKRYSENIQNYLSTLEMLKKGEIQEILPPPEYFKGINEDSEIETGSKPRPSDIEEIKGSFSDNMEDNPLPSVREIYDGMISSKEKYERDLTVSFRHLQDLYASVKIPIKASGKVSTRKTFSSQCPVM